MGTYTPKMLLRRWLALLGAVSIATAAGAQVTVLPNAIPTIDLDRGTVPFTQQTPTGITYHPGFDQYYGINGGSTSYDGFTWAASGGAPLEVCCTPPEPEPSGIGVDTRAVYYNPNTTNIEVVADPDPLPVNELGLMKMGLDAATGFFNGSSSTIMLSGGGPILLSGVSTLSSPAFDPGRDVFYARGFGPNEMTVQVVSRSTGQCPSGAASCTITLEREKDDNDVPTEISIQAGWIGYDADLQVLVTIDALNEEALIHSLSGSLLGASGIAGLLDPTQSLWNAGYTNGQVFVFDESENVWHGARVIVPIPEPSTAALLGAGCLWLSSRRRKRRI